MIFVNWSQQSCWIVDQIKYAFVLRVKAIYMCNSVLQLSFCIIQDYYCHIALVRTFFAITIYKYSHGVKGWIRKGEEGRKRGIDSKWGCWCPIRVFYWGMIVSPVSGWLFLSGKQDSMKTKGRARSILSGSVWVV